MSDLPNPHLIRLDDPGHYTLPDGLRFVGLLDAEGIEAARIRLTLGLAIVLDLPVSAETLSALSRSLIPKVPPAGWRRAEDQ